MKTPTSYYGSKERLAPWITSLLPPHRVYLEPFFGSGAVLFAKLPSLHEVINDLDGDVANFFRVLRDRPEELELACLLTPYARAEYEAARAADPADPVERARRFWTLCTQSFGKSHHGRTGWSASADQGQNSAKKTLGKVGRFAAVAARLRVVVIEQTPAVEVIGKYATPDAVIYCDPPYLGSAREQSGDYNTDMPSEEDHRSLAEALHACPGTVLLSGYRSPLYDDLYADWPRTSQRVTRPVGNGIGVTPSEAEEVVWSNRPIRRQQASLFEDAV